MRGWQAERINRKRNLGEKEEQNRTKRGHRGPGTQLYSKPWRRKEGLQKQTKVKAQKQ